MSNLENNRTLTECLERLESMIDLEHVARTRELQRRAFAFEPVEHVPTAILFPVADEEWPNYGFAEIFDDPAKMLLHELRDVYAGVKLGDDRLYGLRANYGTGIIASMFGCPVHTFDETLPIGMEVSESRLRQILDADAPGLEAGLMPRVLETAAFFRQALKPYPKLSQAVGSQVFDIQGPFDNASIIWGSAIYMAIYDSPELIQRLMALVTETIRKTVRALREVDGCPIEEHDGTWNHLGGLCIRNDSTVNLSGGQYDAFVRDFDAKLLAEFGGWIHFCGRGHQWWPRMLAMPGLSALNPFQGEFYDLYEMYETCEAARVAIVQWTAPVDARCRQRIRTGFSRIISANGYDHAQRLKDTLARTGHADAQ
ncbi:MAG: hypothetical protein GXY33_02405 [Phycisphaerae bacterium]|nr:hypothetical protein [Phycisphaerae bacterium]